MPWFLLLCLPFAAFILQLLPGCCNGGSERSESQRTITSKKEGSKPPGKTPGAKTKAKSVSRQLEVPQQPQKKGEEAKAATGGDGGGGKSDKEVKKEKESQRGQSSKKGKERVVEATQNVTKSDEDAQQQAQQSQQQPQQEQNKTVTEPPQQAEKPPNEFEKAAAGEGVVINPVKVKRMGNIDEIHEARKEEQNKELDLLKSNASKSMKGSKEKEGKKVTINEGKCVLYETADCPTLDDEADNENGEDPI